jgi:hypothetical protein
MSPVGTRSGGSSSSGSGPELEIELRLEASTSMTSARCGSSTRPFPPAMAPRAAALPLCCLALRRREGCGSKCLSLPRRERCAVSLLVLLVLLGLLWCAPLVLLCVLLPGAVPAGRGWSLYASVVLLLLMPLLLLLLFLWWLGVVLCAALIFRARGSPRPCAGD